MIENLLYAQTYKINERITVRIPTLRDIIDNEEMYYDPLSLIVSTPYDYMVQLDDAGIDFSNLNDFELFLLLFEHLKNMDTSLIFPDLDFSKLTIKKNAQNNNFVIMDDQDNVIIDRAIHYQICTILRKINRLERNNKNPGNAEARRFMLERARTKLKRRRKKARTSELEGLIVAMVNTEQFKYNYETVLDLSIYQFNASVFQIIKKIHYDNLMIGCYAGTVDIKKLDQNELNWLSQKK